MFVHDCSQTPAPPLSRIGYARRVCLCAPSLLEGSRIDGEGARGPGRSVVWGGRAVERPPSAEAGRGLSCRGGRLAWGDVAEVGGVCSCLFTKVELVSNLFMNTCVYELFVHVCSQMLSL